MHVQRERWHPVLEISIREMFIKILSLICLSVFILIIPYNVNALFLPKSYKVEVNDVNYEKIVNEINTTVIYQHIKNLSDIGYNSSLITGYPGSKMAAKYIIDAFCRYGLQVLVQNYTITVPIDEQTNITVLRDGHVINAYALWPNFIQSCVTPAGGIEGPIIYVGLGELEDFDGLDVKGSIVLMEFNSGRNWLKAAELGAKAVVFIEPSDTNYREAMDKILQTPLYFPRLYVKAEDGLYLKNEALKGDARINIKSNIKFRNVFAQNIIGVIEGGQPDKADEIIALSAHYDTWSIVPKVAPGADEMTGVASLLELARVFSKERPSRTIWFVALSGHWEALAGAREFVEKYYFEDEKKILILMGLDFSTDSSSVAMVHAGHFYMYGTYTGATYALRRYDGIKKQINVCLDDMKSQLKKDYTQILFDGLVSTGWWAGIPTPYMLDTEPFAVAGGAGFTIRTDRSYRYHWGTPFNVLPKINLENLKPQLEIASCIVYSFIEVKEVPVDWSLVSPKRIYWDVGAGGGASFLTLKGKVLSYDITNGWYVAVPNALVRVQAYQSVWPFTSIITLSDENGSFIIHGGSSSPVLRAGYAQALQNWYIDAYVVNETNGVIEYSPDKGQYGTKSISSTYLVDSHPYEMTAVVFRCKTVTIFNIVDTSHVKTLSVMDPRFAGIPGLDYGYYSQIPGLILPYDYTTLSEFIAYGYFIAPTEPLAMIFVPPGSRFILIFKSGAVTSNVALLLNSTEDLSEGYGYRVEANELRVNFTALHFLYNFISLIDNRYGKMKGYFVRSIDVEELLSKSKEYYNQAVMAVNAKYYSKSYSDAFLGWLYAIEAYKETMKLINDSALMSTEIFAMIVPFAFFFERLIFSAEGKRRLLFFSLSAVTPFVILYLVHPAMHLVSNVLISFLGLSLGCILIIISIIFSNEMFELVKEYRYKTLGRHFVEKNMVSVALFAFPLAVQNMRKRHLRTLLTIITLIVVTFSLTSFTSMTFSIGTKASSISGTGSYNGLLVKSGLGEPNNALGLELFEIIKAQVKPNNSVCPRAWLYPESDRSRGVMTYVYGPHGKSVINAFLGLTPEEGLLPTAIIKGSWFLESDYYSCLITDTTSEILGADVFDYIIVEGLKLKVVGILDNSVLSALNDLDQRSITPLDPASQSVLSPDQVIPIEESPQPESLSWSNIIIIPFDLAKDLGGYISSISVQTENSQDLVFVAEMAKDLARCTQVGCYIGLKESSVTYFSRSFVQQTLGLQFFIVFLILGGLIVFNVLLGSISERKREISIFSYVGTSPLGISILFICEALMYALLSAVIGYLVGISFNAFLITFHMLPEDFILNYSSIFVFVAIIITFGCTLLSSIYPSMLASKLSTPSLERKWKFTIKPTGDKWSFSMPFMFPKDEVHGILAFLAEYFKAHTVESAEVFVSEKVETFYEDKTMRILVTLMPREAHVTQKVSIHLIPKEENFVLEVDIQKLSGIKEVWLSSNYKFVDNLRKQILIWRTLDSEERRKYYD